MQGHFESRSGLNVSKDGSSHLIIYLHCSIFPTKHLCEPVTHSDTKCQQQTEHTHSQTASMSC